jgi:hypothetical protein
MREHHSMLPHNNPVLRGKPTPRWAADAHYFLLSAIIVLNIAIWPSSIPLALS